MCHVRIIKHEFDINKIHERNKKIEDENHENPLIQTTFFFQVWRLEGRKLGNEIFFALMKMKNWNVNTQDVPRQDNDTVNWMEMMNRMEDSQNVEI